MGEPGGIGPEVAMAAYRSLGGSVGGHPLRLVGDASVFKAFGPVEDAAIVPVALPTRPTAGIADPANAPAVLAAIDEAVAWALDERAAAVVTAPIHKSSLMQAGFRFAGHTEYLEHLTQAPRAVMMLAGRGLRVVPLTIHIPLAEVPARITSRLVIETAEIVLKALADDFGIGRPRLAVAGLNPHAGEQGQFGTAEIETIGPACDALRGRGFHVAGPLSADTMFHAEARASYDAALCMYHDQALIPLKTIAFWEGVNVTLGLPIVRTSPDHGTALDIAGRRRADPRSMIEAIELAAAIADARNR
jgi:4-hydroxythreonine-4-phosphate dehydrogenase